MNPERDRSLRRGFTVIELLVVITIISILAAGLTVAVVGTLERTKMKRTESTLESLQNALSSYKARFGAYPPVFSEGGGDPSILPDDYVEEDMVAGDVTFSASGGIPSEAERNNAFRVYLEAKFEGVRESPFIDSATDMGREDVDDDEEDGFREYVDAWHNMLIFLRPGANHLVDVDEDGASVGQRENTSKFMTGSSGTERKTYEWPIDIYSYGPNEIDNWDQDDDGGSMGDHSGEGFHGDDIGTFALSGKD